MKLILQAIKALFRKIEASIDKAQTTANNAKTLADSKMSAINPAGSGAFSMGRNPDSEIGRDSHAEGNSTTASGIESHAEGNLTTASGVCSHAEGRNTTASNDSSHAEGYGTTASTPFSHAEGDLTTASGYSSHAEGSRTTASGSSSHAEGYGTTASTPFSHAEGYYTSASGAYSHAEGKCNIKDTSNTYAHIVGNGSNASNLSNAHTLDWSGNAWFSGDVYVGSTSGTNKDAGSKKLATEEYVDNKVSDFGGIQSPTTAEVGQTIVVKAVDENGKPTAWEAVDVPGGNGSGYGIHMIARVVTEANAASIEVTGLSTTTEVLSLRIYNPGSTCGNGLCITVNGVRNVGHTGSISGGSAVQANVRAWLYRDGDTLYGRSRMSNDGVNFYEWSKMGKITSIAVDSPYNDGTTKYFQTGTIFEIYEGMYPNVS